MGGYLKSKGFVLPAQAGNENKFLKTNGTIPSWDAPLPSQTGSSGKYLVTDGTTPSWSTLPSDLPVQAGSSGKYLATDGSNASWSTLPSDLPSQTGSSGKYLTTDGSSPSWSTLPNTLPDQTGSSGKYLTTDGSTPSWGSPPSGSLPDQTGSSGKYLTTDGANASWATVSGGDSLPDQTGNSGKVLATNGSSALWIDNAGTMGRQAMIDGNFEICQMNPVVATTVENPATGTYPKFDMWKVEYNADSGTLPTSIIHSQTAVTMGDLIGGKYCMRINPNGAGSDFGNAAYYRMSQYIFSGTRRLEGLNQTMTLQLKIRSSIANKKIGVRIIQNYGTGGTPTADEVLTGATFDVTSDFATYTCTFTTNTLVGKTFGTNSNDYLKVEIYYMWGSDFDASLGAGAAETFVGSGTIDVAQIQLNKGSVALEFLLESWGKSFDDCALWVRKSFPYATHPADAVLQTGLRYRTLDTYTYHMLGVVDFALRPMISIPTVLLYNPSVNSTNDIRCYSDAADHPGTVGNLGNHGFEVEVNNSSISAGKTLGVNWSADARF